MIEWLKQLFSLYNTRTQVATKFTAAEKKNLLEEFDSQVVTIAELVLVEAKSAADTKSYSSDEEFEVEFEIDRKVSGHSVARCVEKMAEEFGLIFDQYHNDTFTFIVAKPD